MRRKAMLKICFSALPRLCELCIILQGYKMVFVVEARHWSGEITNDAFKVGTNLGRPVRGGGLGGIADAFHESQ